jgi:iron-sulfur cluster repair protein YtfE (RIC family)
MPLVVLPSPPEMLQSARNQILKQHAELRPHLLAALEAARAAQRMEGDSAAIPSRIILLLAELDSHMAYEEAVLLPLLARDGAQGASAAVALTLEHRRQRREFATLLELARNQAEAAGLALALQSLVADVLADMIGEEEELATFKIVATPPAWTGV